MQISNRASFKLRILRVILVAVIAAISFVTVIFGWFEHDLSKKKLASDLQVLGEIIGNRSIAALIFADENAATNNLQTGRFHQSVQRICLFDAQGSFFASYQRNDQVKPCQFDSQLVASPQLLEIDDTLLFSMPVLDQQERLGQISIVSDTRYVNTILYYLLGVLTVAVILASLIGYGLALGMLRKTLKPLTELYDTAVAVAKDPFSQLRATKSSEDEIGALVDSFNHMLDNLAHENSAVLASEHRFRTLAEHAPIGIYLKDGAQHLLFVNQRWQSITEQQTVMTDAAWLAQIAKDDIENYLLVRQQIEHEKTAKMLEYRYTAPGSGQQHVLMEYIAPLIDDNTGKLSGVIGSVLDVTELKNAQFELEKLAFYDPLTGLPNRRFFRDHMHFTIEAARKSGETLAVMMLDLDHFKKVNDSLGHDAGDDLLVELSSRIRNLVFKEDVVSRMGGDEFMILLKHIDSVTNLEHIAQRILSALKQPVLLGSNSVELSASMGVARFPTDALTPQELVKNADIALYKAKHNGRDGIAYFSSELDYELKKKVRLERKLKLALKHRDLEVYLQAQYEVARGRFCQAEALLRWFDSEDGFISPGVFIPIAEESGLIHRMGRYVLESVCQFLADNQRQLHEKGIEAIAINLSAAQFFSEDLVKDIQDTFNQYHIDPSQIEFELTESLVMEDIEKAIEIMQQLKRLGCTLSIDDFGTGYSSLAYLKKFPIDAIKVDKSFIQGIPEDRNDIEITTAIIAMAHKLGLAVVAEGVETQVQFDFLVEQQCELMQGFLLAKPQSMGKLLNITLPVLISDVGKVSQQSNLAH